MGGAEEKASLTSRPMSHIVSGGMKIRERVGVQIGERVRISRKPNRRDPYADPINPPPSDAFTQDHTVQSRKG